MTVPCRLQLLNWRDRAVRLLPWDLLFGRQRGGVHPLYRGYLPAGLRRAGVRAVVGIFTSATEAGQARRQAIRSGLAAAGADGAVQAVFVLATANRSHPTDGGGRGKGGRDRH